MKCSWRDWVISVQGQGCTPGFTKLVILVTNYMSWYELLKSWFVIGCHHIHRCMGRVSFGGGGAEVSCPNIFSIACTKIKWFCPNITWFFFARKLLFENSRGAAAPPPPPPPPVSPMARTPMIKLVMNFSHIYVMASFRNRALDMVYKDVRVLSNFGFISIFHYLIT